MADPLKIIKWPDPRLRKRSVPVTRFDDNLRALATQMLDLMRESKGVGLAAPQVGLNLRLFVINHTGKPEDDKVYVNPSLEGPDGAEEAEEGCLSLPEINVAINRSTTLTIKAKDVSGEPFEQTETGFITRVWQHEFDHLDGRLITDYMGPVAKIASRKILKQLEDNYAAEQLEAARKRRRPPSASPSPRNPAPPPRDNAGSGPAPAPPQA